MEWFEGPSVHLLPIPYVSQEEEGASKFSNDCGVASAAMLIQACTDRVVTVDDLFQQTGATTDRFLSASEVMAVMRLFGIRSEWKTNLNSQNLFETLIARHPLIALIKYAVLRDASLTESTFGGPHFATVVGVDTGHVYLNDPLWKEAGGKHLAISLDIFEKAWEEVGCDPRIPNPMRGAIILLSALGSRGEGEAKVVRVTPEEGLNIRSGPGMHFNKVGALSGGEDVRILEEHQDPNFRWGKIAERQWIALDFTVEVN